MPVDNFPKKIPIFPLSGAIFFPDTNLPLNIFEPRYIQLVNDCMKGNKLFGMVQPKFKTNTQPEVYNVGCLGKITSFNETADKKFIISLSGIIRFKIEKELKTEKMYREFVVDYTHFLNDLKTNKEEEKYKNEEIMKMIKIFLRKKNYLVETNELEKLNFSQLVNTICMLSPFSNEEKQKLIETVKIEDKVKLLEQIIKFSLHENFANKTIQ